MRFLIYMLSFLWILSACQTSPIRQFSNVKMGMEKSQVLDLMGTPWTSTRLHGKDRWIYVLYDDNIRSEKEVHFLNGEAVYVGDSWRAEPEKTAAQEDKKKEELEKQYKEEATKLKEENKNSFSNYENEIKGSGKKVKYLPDYQEIK